MPEKVQETKPVWGNIEKKLFVIVKKTDEMQVGNAENHKAQISSWDPQ